MNRVRIRYVPLLLVLALGSCQAASDGNTLAEPSLIGAWRLVSWQNTDASGVTTYPFGENPQGQIVYTESGQMSAQLMYPGIGVDDVTGVDETDIIGRVARTFFAYYGPYTVDREAGIVTHHIEGSLRPTWRGTDQVRAFALLSDDRVRLSVTNSGDSEFRTNTAGSNELIWERIR